MSFYFLFKESILERKLKFLTHKFVVKIHVLIIYVFVWTKKVSGRLKQANISYNQKHLVLLPLKNYFTDLIIKDIHS